MQGVRMCVNMDAAFLWEETYRVIRATASVYEKTFGMMYGKMMRTFV
jgi:hypothetical protein